MKKTLLYNSGGFNVYAPYQTEINLLDNLSNYDIVEIITGMPSSIDTCKFSVKFNISYILES